MSKTTNIVDWSFGSYSFAMLYVKVQKVDFDWGYRYYVDVQFSRYA